MVYGFGPSIAEIASLIPPYLQRLCGGIVTAAGTISVWNNGRGIPIEIHKEHNCYVPELIFGKYLTLFDAI